MIALTFTDKRNVNNKQYNIIRYEAIGHYVIVKKLNILVSTKYYEFNLNQITAIIPICTIVKLIN